MVDKLSEGFGKREALLKEQQGVIGKIKDLDTKLKDLKFLYDQYFIGLERAEPQKLRKEVKDMVNALINTYIKSTVQKFKLNALIARHNSYTKLWDRITREIEEGRYKRDIFRLKVNQWHKDRDQTLATQNKAPNPMDKLFASYISSRKKSNESSNISKDKFVKTIQAQITEIKKKFKCKNVSFKIVIENGKTKLKAQPKK